MATQYPWPALGPLGGTVGPSSGCTIGLKVRTAADVREWSSARQATAEGWAPAPIVKRSRAGFLIPTTTTPNRSRLGPSGPARPA